MIYTCENCRFYSPIRDGQGECRANPPTVFVVPVNTLQGQGIGFQPVFPAVTETIWCGLHEMEENEPIEH